MEPLGVDFFLTLARENPLLTIVVIVALALGVMHEFRISIDIVALLARHFRSEFGHSAQSVHNLGDSLSARREPAQTDELRDKRRRRRKRKVARQARWLRRRMRRHPPLGVFSFRRRRKVVRR